MTLRSPATAMVEPYVLALDEVSEADVALAGGKGAQLGALSRIDGAAVPAGFCVTTAAFRQTMASVPFGDLLDRLAQVDPKDRELTGTLSAQVRALIEQTTVPADVETSIRRALAAVGDRAAVAVRSSATAEDLPTASFAGQQDTFLNVVGPAAVLHHVSRCWASVFTERAVTYRQHHGIDHPAVQMAVVVQLLLRPTASGVLFTADPVTGNRRIASVEAVLGLGEAFVSGLVTPDAYTVRDGRILSSRIGTKHLAVRAGAEGGTRQEPVGQQQRDQPALTDAQVLELVELGRRVEKYFGLPQDIEWCLTDEGFHLVQSRPITTLFPIPGSDDRENHVYVSVGHQQMMTDAMTPLGLSFWQLTTPAPMAEAGGRLFVDVTQRLAMPDSRAELMAALDRSDPLIADALQSVLDRADFIRPLPGQATPAPRFGGPPAPIDTDPAVVTGLIERSEESIAAAEQAIAMLKGPALFEFIQQDLQELRRILFDPQGRQVYMSAMEASWWLNDRLWEWLGEKNVADTLTQSVPHNITSEMGLALLDVADALRPYPEVVAFLQAAEDDSILEGLATIPGGSVARAAIGGWLDRYGMRCAGEIDITRPRWSERPAMLAPVILGNIRNFEPGEGARRFEQGRRAALATAEDVLRRVRALPDGERKADETAAMIDRVRTYIGYREYPKYGMISRYFVYKKALTAEADRLVRTGVLRRRDDSHYLRFAEFHELARTNRVDNGLIDRRRAELASYRSLTPPRVLTSDGEALTGSYRRNGVPAGALVGLPVSAGVVEGRARVILDMAHAALDAGDILVTTCTDPSWTPLFVAIAGLVTEVGGQMTHGAVIAREYGLPAVVGVVDATRLIADGQRIRVHGTEGYIELLPPAPPSAHR